VLSAGRRCPNAALAGSRYCGLPQHQALSRFGTNQVTVLAALNDDEIAILADSAADQGEVTALVQRAEAEHGEEPAEEAPAEAEEPEPAQPEAAEAEQAETEEPEAEAEGSEPEAEAEPEAEEPPEAAAEAADSEPAEEPTEAQA
jgi:transcription termination/antitermination protein NusA